MADPADLAEVSNLPNFPRIATPDDAPVTVWLRQLEAGNGDAAEPLYQHFCARLQDLARKRLPARVGSVYDHDDVAVSAFHSLFLGIREQRFQLQDRNDLWRLLLMIAERKIAHRIRHELRDKRDVRRLVQNTVFLQGSSEQPHEIRSVVDSLEGREPTPEFAAEVKETCDSLLELLADDHLRRIALLKLENHTSEEIASELACSRRTVQRKLLVIRRTWQDEGGIERGEKGIAEANEDTD